MSCSNLFSAENVCLRVVYLDDNLAIYGNARLIRARNLFISGESRKSIILQGPQPKGSNLALDLVMTNFMTTKRVAVTSILSLVAQGTVQQVFQWNVSRRIHLDGFRKNS